MKTKYAFTEKCPDVAYVQHIDSGDFDYSEYDSFDAAAIAARDEWYPRVNTIAYIDGDGDAVKHTAESALQETKDTMGIYSRDEIMSSAESGYGWPISLGFVEEVDDEA